MLLRCSKGSQPCPIRRPSLHDLHSRKFLGWVTGGTEESWLDAKSPEGGQARWTPRTSCLCRLSSFGGAVSIRGCPHPNAAPPGPGAPHPLELRGPTSFHRLPSPHTSSGGQSCGHGFEVCCLSLGLSKPLRPKFHLGQPQWLERDRRVQGRVDQAFFFFLSFTKPGF